MAVIAITLLLWFCSILTRAIEDQKKQKTIDRIDREVKTNATIVRQLEREQRVLAEEQRKQAEQLAKHDEKIAKLEQRVAIAEEEIEFQYAQIAHLREHIDHAYVERDACVYGSSNYFKWDKKCMTLEKQIHTAESKLANAEFTAAQAKQKLEVA